MNKQNLTLLGIVVLVVLIGGAFWFTQIRSQGGERQPIISQPTSDSSFEDLFADSESAEFPKTDVSGWQDYQNDGYGIKLKIPKNWELKNKNDENKALCFGKKGKNYYDEGAPACGVMVMQSIGISDWTGEKGKDNYQKWKEAFQVMKYKVTVDNQEAIFWKGNGFLITSVPLVSRDMRQEVRLDYNGEPMQEEESVYYGIVQTLSIQ